jgi:hypothetical protein
VSANDRHHPEHHPEHRAAGTVGDSGSHDVVREREHDRKAVVAREREEHGGIKWGSAFFGWLTAAGTAILVTAVLSAIGAAVGLGALSGVQQAEREATQNAETVGLIGGIALLVILFVAYYAGGYVAGRMARFDGAKQGLAVWLWALAIAVLVAALAAIAGSRYDVLSQLNSLPRLPLSEGDLTTGGIITAVAAVAASLGGAVLGGLAGMRFHRKVDRTGLGA